MVENTYPVTFIEYGLTPNSGGKGKTRGGLGLSREFQLDAPQGVFAANLDRFKFPPPGLQGGEAGAAGQLLLKRTNSENYENLPSKISGVSLQKGDRVRLQTSGGGGYGNPAERSEDRVETDLADAYCR